MKWFLRLATLTVLATYLLIFIGGLVRVSGAGLGCPDWPRCYGSWVPPLSPRHLQLLVQNTSEGTPGYEALQQVDLDHFNFTLVWIEYVNRLVGVIIGLLIVATAILAMARVGGRLAGGAVLAVVLVAVQGWLGGLVVKSELHSLLVSLHMGLALLLVSLLLALLMSGSLRDAPRTARFVGVRRQLAWLWGLGIAQVTLGAWLRGALEDERRLQPLWSSGELLDMLGPLKVVHVGLGIGLALAGLWIGWRLLRQRVPGPANGLAMALVGLSVVQALVGLTFRHLGLLPIAQLVHLWLASLWIGVILVLILVLRHELAVDRQWRRTGRWLGAGVAACLLVAVGGLAVIRLAEISRRDAQRDQVAASISPTPAGRVYRVVPPFVLTRQDGAPFGENDLDGRITILCFMFTTCPTICPLMHQRLAEIYREYAHSDRLQLVSISVDPETDSQTQLQAFAARHGVVDHRWSFLRGPLAEVCELSTRGFNLTCGKQNHSGRLVLIDPQRRIRGFYDYSSLPAMRALRDHLNAVAREYWP